MTAKSLLFREVSTADGEHELVVLGDSEEEAWPDVIRVSHELLIEILSRPSDRVWLEDGADQLHIEASNGSAVYAEREPSEIDGAWRFHRQRAHLDRPVLETSGAP